MGKLDDIDDCECGYKLDEIDYDEGGDHRWSVLYETCIKLERAAIFLYEEEHNKWVEFWGNHIRLF